MILKNIWLDIKTVQERDPVVRNAPGVFLFHQGVYALIWHGLTCRSYKHRMYFITRLISQIVRSFILVEIHPGAQLDHGILIDHGSGVVIGETTAVGDNCTIYQGVTLGGAGTEKEKRHPTLSSNVIVGAGTKIPGAFEVGGNCTIAANAVLPKPLEDNVTVVGIPARPVKKDRVTTPKNKRSLTLEEYEDMKYRLEQMEREIALLKDVLAGKSNAGGKG